MGLSAQLKNLIAVGHYSGLTDLIDGKAGNRADKVLATARQNSPRLRRVKLAHGILMDRKRVVDGDAVKGQGRPRNLAQAPPINIGAVGSGAEREITQDRAHKLPLTLQRNRAKNTVVAAPAHGLFEQRGDFRRQFLVPPPGRGQFQRPFGIGLDQDDHRLTPGQRQRFPFGKQPCFLDRGGRLEVTLCPARESFERGVPDYLVRSGCRRHC